MLKNWCFQIVVLNKTLESLLDYKDFKPVNPKGNQPWISIERTIAEALILWPPDEKRDVIGKDLDLGKIEGKRRRGKQGMRWLGSITNSLDMNLSTVLEIVEDRGVWLTIVHKVAKSQTWFSDWATEIIPWIMSDVTIIFSLIDIFYSGYLSFIFIWCPLFS